MTQPTVPATVPQAQTATPTDADRALAAQLYAGTDVGKDDTEGLEFVAEQLAAFRQELGRNPRSAGELDAWSESPEVWAGFLADHPIATLDPAPAAPAPADQKPIPEPTPPTAAEQTAAQAADAKAAAEAAEAAARDEAVQTLRAAAKHYRQGEKAYRAGLLEAGRLSGLYVQQRLALGDKRAAATDQVTLELSRYSSTTVDANRLIGCWEAYRLLAVDTGLATAPEGKKTAPADSVPYGHYRDAWSRLVTRTAKDTPAESWTLLPGLEAECKAAFAKAVADGLSKAAVDDMARTLVTQAEAASAEAARVAKGNAEAAAQTAAAEVKRQREELAARNAAAQQAAREAEQAKTAAPEQAEQLAKAAAEAKDALLAQQRETIAAEERDRLAQLEKARKEREAAEAQRKATEAEAKKATAERKRQEREAAKGAPKPAPAAQPATVDPSSKPAEQKPAPESKPTLGNLLVAAKAAGAAGTAKDVAEMAAELVTGAEAPDDVLEALLTILAAHKELSKAGHRACQAALVVLKRAESPAPATVAATLEAKPEQANGTVPAAA